VNVEGERAFTAPRAIVWEVLNDPEAMAKTMPGVESFDVHDANRWTARVNVPLALGALKLKIDMEKTDSRELESASMQLKGKGVGAFVNMQTRFDLSDAAAGQPIVHQQVEHVLGALDEQVQSVSRRQADQG
jgi:uncharacterized protein